MVAPKIGITCGEDVKEGKVFLTNYYLRCIQRAGGIPWLIPSIEKNISEYLSSLDGVILSGGVDVDPLYFDEEPIIGMGEITPGRDNFEIKLTQAAKVNSFHHQAVSELADGVLSIAGTTDGIVEAVTMPDKKFVLGVQWHPECMAERFKEQQQIFNEFVKAST